VVICEYLNETQGSTPMYPVDALSSPGTGHGSVATQTFTEGWQFLPHATP
jgi:glutathione S-transferase